MYIAAENFSSGKGFQFKKDEQVFGDEGIIRRLISEGLVREVDGPSVPDVKAAIKEQDEKKLVNKIDTTAEAGSKIPASVSKEEKPKKKKSKG